MEDLEFYKRIPVKVCRSCGWKIEEQYESYVHECEHCKEIINEE